MTISQLAMKLEVFTYTISRLRMVKRVASPGTLQVQPLTSDITAPENNVNLTSIPADNPVIASVAFGNADVEKMAQVYITAAVKSGSFKKTSFVEVIFGKSIRVI